MLTRLLLVLVLAALAACGTDATTSDVKQSAAGESCSKAADCIGDLDCVSGVCTIPGAVADATSWSDIAGADSEAIDAADVSPPPDGSTDTSSDACVPSCPAGACADGCGGVCPAGPCDDGSKCTTGDACTDGLCIGTPIICDDNNPCTEDSCAAPSGCTNLPNAASCTDGNPCTVGDLCNASACQPGAVKDCPSGDVCVIGKCSAVDGVCKFSNVPDGSMCSDDNQCSTSDVCAGGACTGANLDCDDKKPCTVDTCNPNSGCQHANIATQCDDGNGCSVGDLCQGGTCLPGQATTCDDANLCTKDSCNAQTGKCANSADALEGTSCDADGSACSVADQCKDGVCTPGKPAACEDGNACTADGCAPATGCTHEALTGACNADDNVCTVDVCQSGACVAGKPKICDDGNACTVDSCSSATGACSYDPAPKAGKACDADKTVCTPNDTCKSGNCVADAPLNCDDGNACTVDKCDSVFGCANPPLPDGAPCSDGDACTADDYCAKSKCSVGKANDCSDGNPCTDDSCDIKTGTCAHVNSTAACDDGSPCTEKDVCGAGTCVGAAFDCDPCMFYGGVVATVAVGHVKLCSSKVFGADIGVLKVPKPWRTCVLADMQKYAPSKSLCELGVLSPPKTQQQVGAWIDDSCSVNGKAGRRAVFNGQYSDGSCIASGSVASYLLNDANAFGCQYAVGGGYVNDQTLQFLVCKD